MTDTDRTQWLTRPTSTHVATYHGAQSEDEEMWAVVYLDQAPEGFDCGACDEEVTAGDSAAYPSDGQGDPICLGCAFGPHLRAVATLTPEQAARMSWWDTTQPTPEEVGAVAVRVHPAG